jgi:hypothetical protein
MQMPWMAMRWGAGMQLNRDDAAAQRVRDILTRSM